MKPSFLISFSLLVILLTLSMDLQALAQGKQTSPVQRIVSLATTEGDSRLESKVKLDYSSVSLKTILDHLQKTSGVKIRVRGNQTWINDLHTTTYVQNLPLHTVLRRFANLHHLTWYAEQSTPSSPPEYVLYESSINRQYIESFRGIAKKAVLAHINSIKFYLQMNQTDLQKRASLGDFIAAEIMKPGGREHALLLTRLPATAMERLVEGRSVVDTFENLDRPSQNILREYLRILGKADKEGYEKLLAEGKVDYPFNPRFSNPQEVKLKYKVQNSGASSRLMLLFDSSRSVLSMLFASNFYYPTKHWVNEKLERAKKTVPAAMYFENRKTNAAFNYNAKVYDNYLKKLADTYQFNIFSDAYPYELPLMEYKPYDRDEKDEKKKKAVIIREPKGAALSEILKHSGQWKRARWQDGNTGNDFLFLRYDWYEFRDNGAWNALTKSIWEKKQKQLPLSFEDNLKVGLLANEQYLPINHAFNWEPDFLRDNRDVLRMYQSLRRDEQGRLLRSGIGILDLPKDKQPLFEDIITSTNAKLLEEASSTLRLKLTVSKQNYSQFQLVDPISGKLLKSWHINGIPNWAASRATK